MSKNKSDTKVLTPVKTLDEIKKELGWSTTSDYPDLVLKEASKELEGKEEGKLASTPESNLFKSLTLFEFENGILLTTVVPEQYKTFGIDLMKNLQKEFNCQTTSEKATTELASVNYIRTLEIQNRINRYLAMGTITDTGMRFLDIMSKELDRANHHYLTAIQALRDIKQPQIGVNIKAQTAIVGQNQIVQANNLPNDL